MEQSIRQRQMKLKIVGRVLESHTIFRYCLIKDAHLTVGGGAGHVSCAELAKKLFSLVRLFQGFTRAMQLQVRERQAKARNATVRIHLERWLKIADGCLCVLHV